VPISFCTSSGDPLGHRNVSRGIRSAGDKVQLNDGKQPVSCHDLRHSFASRLLSQGRDAGTIAAMLGDTVETVIRVYIHGHAWKGREASEWASATQAFSL
jgi:site-specific recombinase XerD